MDKPTDENILDTALLELRRIYDHISNIYDQLRIKSLALIAGEVAIVSFIFSGESSIAIPLEVYGRIFFFTAIILVAIALGIFLWTISTSQWGIPADMREIKNLTRRYNSNKDFKQFLIADYLECIEHCISVTDPKQKRFNWGIYMLAVGVIILLVIKFGGENLSFS